MDKDRETEDKKLRDLTPEKDAKGGVGAKGELEPKPIAIDPASSSSGPLPPLTDPVSLKGTITPAK